MTEPENGNHINDTTTPADAATGYVKSRIVKFLRHTIWLIPFLAVINFVQTAIKLGIGTEDWQTVVTNLSQTVLKFDPEPFSCLVTSVVLFVY